MKASTPPSRLAAYVASVAVGGLGLAGLTLWLTPWSDVGGGGLILVLAVCAMGAIAGEVKPVEFSGGGGEARTLSISMPFVLAALGLGGLGVALLAQFSASLIDDLVHRRPIIKCVFNSGQYALSVVAAGVAYALMAGEPIISAGSQVELRQVGALIAAGVVMVSVNSVLVAGVVAIISGASLPHLLRQGAYDLFLTNLVLLSIGGIAALIAENGVLALVLLAAPVIAAHMFAASGARHAHQATHDALTGLGNRSQLHRSLELALANQKAAGADGPGLILVDLDHFKDINDALGHPVGDHVLRQVAKRLVDAVDDPEQVHRLGGDEFAIVVSGGLGDARMTAEALLASLDAAVPVESLELLVRASAGLAVAPQHGDDVSELMKNADVALYHAKVERGRMSTYAADLDVNSVERLHLLADLRTALDDGVLTIVYQPQIELTGRTLVGVEALVRWKHPERGNVRPDDFIPLAENSGLIFPLTAFVLDRTLAQLAKWRSAGHELRLAVNLSARHLSDLALPDQVWEAAARHGVPLTSLVLEVTETGILSDPTRAAVVIRSLRELGVEVSIDDYGTGNASLNYLKRLEIDELKVDRSFVASVLTDPHDHIIVRSTVELARSLGLRVVAEGIEDEETLVALRAFGRLIGQGYHLGKPMLAKHIDAMLAAETARVGQGS